MSRKFNIDFMIEEINKAEELLASKSLTKEQKQDLKDMINKFNIYIDDSQTNKNEGENYNKINYKLLEKKLNHDLKILNIELCNGINYLYQNIEQYTFGDKVCKNFNLTDEEMFNFMLDFYQKLDEEYYTKALQIIQCPISLINFDEAGKIVDECFRCDYLKAPFINVNANDKLKHINLIHEIQHGIDLLVTNFKINNLLIEAPPIFIEILFADLLSELYNCEGLYAPRINDHMCILDWLNAYANILIKFYTNHRKITKNNIMDILGVENKDALLNMYKKFMKKDFINYFRYAMSMFVSIELREKYYNEDKEDAIRKLKEYVSGEKTDINFNRLVNSFNNYIEEIKEKSYVYMKTVK